MPDEPKSLREALREAFKDIVRLEREYCALATTGQLPRDYDERRQQANLRVDALLSHIPIDVEAGKGDDGR